MVKIKICGITNITDANIAVEEGADFLGFVFADSPRKVSIEEASSIIDKVPEEVKIVALFVNEHKKFVDNVIDSLPKVDLLQFHGDEPAEYCNHFKDRKIIKVIRIENNESVKQIEDFKGSIDYILLDTFNKDQYGGTGRSFDWEIAKKAKDYSIPIFLSGGLNPDNVKEAISNVSPYAVDVSSGVEASPGKKDLKLLKKFISIAKES